MIARAKYSSYILPIIAIKSDYMEPTMFKRFKVDHSNQGHVLVWRRVDFSYVTSKS